MHVLHYHELTYTMHVLHYHLDHKVKVVKFMSLVFCKLLK